MVARLANYARRVKPDRAVCGRATWLRPEFRPWVSFENFLSRCPTGIIRLYSGDKLLRTERWERTRTDNEATEKEKEREMDYYQERARAEDVAARVAEKLAGVVGGTTEVAKQQLAATEGLRQQLTALEQRLGMLEQKCSKVLEAVELLQLYFEESGKSEKQLLGLSLLLEAN